MFDFDKMTAVLSEERHGGYMTDNEKESFLSGHGDLTETEGAVKARHLTRFWAHDLTDTEVILK